MSLLNLPRKQTWFWHCRRREPTDNNDQLSPYSLLTGNDCRYQVINVASMINDTASWLWIWKHWLKIAPHFYTEMDHSFHNTVLLILCSKISFFAVIYLLTHLFKSLQENSDTDDNSVLLLIIIPVTSVFIMLTFVNINTRSTPAGKITGIRHWEKPGSWTQQRVYSDRWYSRRWA